MDIFEIAQQGMKIQAQEQKELQLIEFKELKLPFHQLLNKIK